MDEDLDIEINNEKLISLIKNQPAIYDKTSPLDINEKQKIWLNICKELVGDWEERTQHEKTEIGKKVYSRWKNLKTCFKTEYYSQQEEIYRSSFFALRHGYLYTEKKRKQYEYYDQLLFLLPTMEVKKGLSKTNFREGPVPEKRQMTSKAASRVVFEDSSDTFSPPASAGEQCRTIPSVQIPGYKLPLIKRITSGLYAGATQSNAPGRAPQPVPIGTAAQRVAPTPPVDGDRHFLLSMLPALQRMTRYQKLKTKIKFLQVIYDVEAEAQETLQRHLYFAHHASEQNPPVPVPGGVRQFHEQINHTSYSVRERLNKRARMMAGSTGTVLQAKANNGNLQENVQVANSQENAASGILQENAKVANLQEKTVSGSIQEVSEDAKSHESNERLIYKSPLFTVTHMRNVKVGQSQEHVDIGNVQEIAVVTNSQENVEMGNVQQNLELGNSHEIAEVRNSQENVETDNIQATVENRNSQENVKVVNSEEHVVIIDVQETAEVSNLQESVKVVNSEEHVDIIDVQETAEVSNLQENVKVVNSEEHVEIMDVQESAEGGNLQENVANVSESMDIVVGLD